MLGIPSSGWASSLQTFRMWETEDEGGWISSLSGYSVRDGERKRQGVREGGGKALLRGAPGNPV